MSNTPPSGNELPNKKGKEKAGESSDAVNLNLNERVIDQGAAPSTKNKGKEIMMAAEQPPNPNIKRKAIVLVGPDHYPRDDQGSKNPRTGGVAPHEEGGEQKQNSPPSLKEPISGNNKQKKTDAPLSYTCDFCDRSFVSPQALGGHQNGHKWERHMRNGMDVIHMAMERGSSMEPPPPPQLFTRAQGPSLTRLNMNQPLLNMNDHAQHYNNHPMMINALMMGNGNQYDVPFQHGVGIPSLLDAAGTGNNTAPFYPKWAGAGFATGPSGAIEIGNNDGYHYPEEPWFNHGYENGYNAGGFGSYGALDSGYGAFYHQEGAWFNPGYEIGYNGAGAGYYDPFQRPELVWMNHGGIGTGYNGGLENTDGLHEQIDNPAYDLTQLQHGGSGTPSEIDELDEFVLLPDRVTQEVGMVEIDFGLVPKGDGDGDDEEDTEAREEEEEAIDLTLKL